MAERVLVVEDDPQSLAFLGAILQNEGLDVTTAEGGEKAIELTRLNDYDLVMTDLQMPRVNGIQVLEAMQRIGSPPTSIVFTGFGSIETAVQAMKAGAYEYVTKPFQVDELLIVVRRALEHRKLVNENISLRRQLRAKYRFDNIVGTSDRMMEMFRLIEKVADSDSTILIYGESGTGKELVARAIHYNSRRQDKNLVPVNCGAIPSELLEDELFGHEKGAFTGATSARMGRFELAHRGTIFLDEVGDMSPALQVKVLRVLQESEFERVGGSKTIKVDVRVIAATNQDIEKAVETKQFRKDLFYRLNVIPIILPPLRERRSDIPILTEHFLQQFNHRKEKSVKGVSAGAMDRLMEYDWPGNVRELENMIERLVILNEDGVIEEDDLPEKVRRRSGGCFAPNVEIPEEGVSLKVVVDSFERNLILQALERTGWVKKRAAKLLGMNRTTLVEKMKKINLERPETT